ncbi:type I-C CRISPR-associated protein Cas8c/Csd1 [Actinoallomurus sp. NPDC052308]|uniref:type I-C CRISPR-associated protein Cas8c/Csd1 n=1 Tax=Actinoallomurus sp. NPDC052308 TaxID=3155530 RepID=UPI00343E3A4D
MLLKKLIEHGQGRVDLPPPYYRKRAIRWVIHLDTTEPSRPVELGSLADAGNPAGRVLATPYIYRSGRTPPPMLLVDTLEYVLGMLKDDSDKAERDAEQRNDQYVALIHGWRDSAPTDPAAQAVCTFFDAERHLQITIPEEAKPSDTVAIRVDSAWAHLQPSAQAFWAQVVGQRKSTTTSGGAGVCLVCGQVGSLLTTIPEPIKAGAIPAASGRGRDAQLISINKPAQGRGGAIQLANTPVCADCGSQVMAALNALLTDRAHHHRNTDSALVWWLRDPAEPDWLQSVFTPQLADVKELIRAAHRPYGDRALAATDENAFYAVTLGANQSRVVVRDWIEVPIPTLKANLGTWFTDHQVIDPWNDDGPQPVPLRRLVQAAGRWDKRRNQYITGTAPHATERVLLLAAIRATPPPTSLLPNLLQRIRADHRIDPPRIALLRLILNRPPHRRRNQEPLMPELNIDADDPAYLWGRTFAVFEAIQRKALPEVNTTIADRYFSVAMTQPLATFRSLRVNAKAHLRKLQRSQLTRGAGYALDSRLIDLVARLKEEPPAHLDMRGQARFILGYDHQRATDIAAARAAKGATADA